MRNAIGWIVTAAVIILILIIAVPFFTENQQVTEEEFGIGGGPGVEEDLGATANEILETPDQYMNQQVTLTSEVEEVVSDNAFSIDAVGVIGDNLLVVTGSGVQSISPDDDITPFSDRVVRVTGTVREFNTQEVEQDLGVDLDDTLYGGWEEQPYISASRVEIVQEE